jgi:hypothetical protein
MTKKISALPALTTSTDATKFLAIADGATQTVTGSVFKTYLTSTDLSVTGNISPSINNTYTLGTPNHKWADLYIGPNSISIEDTANSANVGLLTVTNGVLLVNGVLGLQSNLLSGTSSLTLAPSGNINLTVGGTSNVLQVTSSNATVDGDLVVTGNITNQPTFGQFYYNANIALNAGNTAQAVTFNNTIANHLVEIDSGSASSHIVINKTGHYRVKYTCAMITNSNQTEPVYFWLKKNGTDVPHSGMQNTLTSKNVQYTVTSDFIINNVTAGDYIELYWAAKNTTVSMVYNSAITSPFTMPENPSATINIMSIGA